MTANENSIDSRESSFREKLLEHVFVSELLQEAWLNRKPQMVEVLRSEVDSSGYDLVLECNGVVRHVQLKSSRDGAKTSRQNVNVKLAKKPCGCVVWLNFAEAGTPKRVKLSYLFFGGRPGEPLCDDETLRGFQITKHTKGDATGHKAERPGSRVVPKSAFTKIASTRELLEKLFGCPE